jgi:hypothetical protein
MKVITSPMIDEDGNQVTDIVKIIGIPKEVENLDDYEELEIYDSIFFLCQIQRTDGSLEEVLMEDGTVKLQLLVEKLSPELQEELWDMIETLSERLGFQG